MGIIPRNLQISKLFEQSDVYDVPSYQRDYKWNKIEVTTLIKDMIDFKSMIESSNSEQDYFMGTIILQKTRSGTEESKRADWYLIDGQQRITTFFLIYKYFISKRFELLEEKPTKTLSEEFERVFRKPGNNRFKLQNKNEQLEKYITNPSSTNPNDIEIYENNYKLIFKMLNDQIKTISDLEEWEELMNKMQLGVIEATDSQNAELIFENINSKGKHLTLSEKLKNKLLLKNNLLMKQGLLINPSDDIYKKTNSDLEERIVKSFESIENLQNRSSSKADNNIKHLGIKDANDIVRAICTYIFIIEIQSGDQAFGDIKTKIDAILEFDQLNMIVTELEKTIHWIDLILAVISQKVEESFYIKWICNRTIGFLPLIFKIFEKLDDSQINDIISNDYSSISEDIRFLFNLIARVSLHTEGMHGKNIWREVPKLLTRGENFESTRIEEKFQDAFGTEAESDVKKDFGITYDEIRNPDLYKNQRGLLKALLLIVERNLHSINNVPEELNWTTMFDYLDDSKITIEHIIPQKINNTEEEGKAWLADLGDFNYQANTDKIGNLTLSTDKMNKSMSNNRFEKKRDEFFAKSKLMLNKEIAGYMKFSEDEFNSRSKEISEILETILN